MANWKLAAGIAGAVIVLAAIGNTVDGDDSGGSNSRGSGGATRASGTGTRTGDARAAVPDVIGMGLQSAQDTAQELGFRDLTSHDSLGRGRRQVFDRNWKVCSQNVAAGETVPTDTRLDFGAVKFAETCPAEDQAAPSAADGTMPRFAGKSVKVARAALGSGTSVTVTDASGDDRMVLVESNWQVCGQTPAPGTELDGQPVEFTAVKFGERCP